MCSIKSVMHGSPSCCRNQMGILQARTVLGGPHCTNLQQSGMVAHLPRPQELLVQHADVPQRLGGRSEERDVHPAGAGRHQAGCDLCVLAGQRGGALLRCSLGLGLRRLLTACARRAALSLNALSALWGGSEACFCPEYSVYAPDHPCHLDNSRDNNSSAWLHCLIV